MKQLIVVRNSSKDSEHQCHRVIGNFTSPVIGAITYGNISSCPSFDIHVVVTHGGLNKDLAVPYLRHDFW